MVLSGIPRFGHVHSLKVFRKADAYDAAGGVTPGGAETVVYAALAGRVASMSDEDEQKAFGNATGERWKVLTDYAPLIQRSDFVTLAAGSQSAPIASGINYRVLYVKHQIDHVGGFHHTSVAFEKEDT